MKKTIFTILLIISTLNSFSQIGKGSIIISFDGNYMKTASGNGTSSNNSQTKVKHLSIGTSAGYFLTDHLLSVLVSITTGEKKQ